MVVRKEGVSGVFKGGGRGTGCLLASACMVLLRVMVGKLVETVFGGAVWASSSSRDDDKVVCTIVRTVMFVSSLVRSQRSV